MNFLRKHWYDLGGLFAIITATGLYYFHAFLTDYQLLMWLSLMSLFLHQLEEYRINGTFPGMANRVMFNSDIPDRFPLNTNSALFVNVYFGWTVYLLAAVAGERAIWLGLATIIVSIGNTLSHTIVFNIKGKTLYNAGLVTSWLFFVPCIYFFFKIVNSENLITSFDYLIGIPLGIAFNFLGILKPMTWFADKNTSYIFEQRNLLPQDRKK
jgi:uncharacterized protein with HXXEE motif